MRFKTKTERWIHLYTVDGLTCQQIADIEGCTKQNISRCMMKKGIKRKDSARSKQIAKARQERLEAHRKRVDDNFRRIYQVGIKEAERIPEHIRAKVKEMYRRIITNARRRNKPDEVKIDLLQFWTVWKLSRRFQLRGRTKNSYHLTRKDFSKDLTLGNVIIEKRSDTYRRMNPFKHDSL